MLSEFWAVALGGSGQAMSACRSFLGVLDKDEFLKIDGTTLLVKLTTGPYAATFDRHGLTDIQGEASARNLHIPAALREFGFHVVFAYRWRYGRRQDVFQVPQSRLKLLSGRYLVDCDPGALPDHKLA